MELIGLGRYADAVDAMANAVRLDPLGAPPVALAAAYQMMQQGYVAAALTLFARIAELQPGYVPAQQGRAIALIALQRFEEALPVLALLKSSGSTIDYLPGIALHARLQCCDWSDFDAARTEMASAVRRGERADAPLSFIVHNESPADQRRCAEIYAADKCSIDAAHPAPATHTAPATRPHPGTRAPDGPRAPYSRLRIAYLSSDLRDHAVGQLLAGVFESHDRSRFETYAFSTGGDESPLRQRIERSFEHFLDMGAAPDAAIAARMAELSIDIAVDLGGFSMSGRTRVLAHRPAPVQVAFLGFPGTSGAGFIDYIVADHHVIPTDQQTHYTEQVIYLPDTFLPAEAPVPAALPSRAQAGLPQEGLVFCCFNAAYKITPPLFDVWLQLLNTVPGSVLWLREPCAAAKRNLSAAAARRGIDPARLIFALRTDTRAEHQARFALADLFLDTYPYNGHTTASEALGLGVPVITLGGMTFASRVAGSLLRACELPALAVQSLDAYLQKALELSASPGALADLRSHLEVCRTRSPLFNPVRFCRHLEAAYTEIWSRHRHGAPRGAVWVEPAAG